MTYQNNKVLHANIYQPFLKERLIKFQKEDDTITKIREIKRNNQTELKKSKNKGYNNFIKSVATNYYEIEGIALVKKKNSMKILLPEELFAELLEFHHNDNTAILFHKGVNSTYNALNKSFTCFKFFSKIRNFITACEVCGKSNPTHKRFSSGEMANLVIENIPFHTVGMDVIGPLPTTPSGHRYIIVFVDHFTKYAKFVPVATITATTIALSFINNWLLVHSSPVNILTDRGKEFNNKIMEQIEKLQQYTHTKSWAYWHQANGVVERLNRNVRNSLNKHEDMKNWDDYVSLINFKYNVTEHGATKATPYLLAYGRDPTLTLQSSTLDVSNNNNQNEDKMNESTYEVGKKEANNSTSIIDNYVADIKNLLTELHKKAAENIDKQHDKNRKSIKPKYIPDLCVGDQIYVKNEKKNKTKQLFVGPFTIIKVMSTAVRIIGNKGKTMDVHISRIKKGMTREINTEEMEEDEREKEEMEEDEIETEEMEYEREEKDMEEEDEREKEEIEDGRVVTNVEKEREEKEKGDNTIDNDSLEGTEEIELQTNHNVEEEDDDEPLINIARRNRLANKEKSTIMKKKGMTKNIKPIGKGVKEKNKRNKMKRVKHVSELTPVTEKIVRNEYNIDNKIFKLIKFNHKKHVIKRILDKKLTAIESDGLNEYLVETGDNTCAWVTSKEVTKPLVRQYDTQQRKKRLGRNRK